MRLFRMKMYILSGIQALQVCKIGKCQSTPICRMQIMLYKLFVPTAKSTAERLESFELKSSNFSLL